jgi:hypothetical protein
MSPETSSPQTQTWLTALTAIAGTLGAVLAKKRLTRAKFTSLDTRHSSLLTKLDSNHKEILSAISTQSTAIEKRLDALESAVARLDERTRK